MHFVAAQCSVAGVAARHPHTVEVSHMLWFYLGDWNEIILLGGFHRLRNVISKIFCHPPRLERITKFHIKFDCI